MTLNLVKQEGAMSWLNPTSGKGEIVIKTELAKATGLYWEVSRCWQGHTTQVLSVGTALTHLAFIRQGVVKGGKLEQLEAQLNDNIIKRRS
jgi:hypothetical protein